MKGCGSLARCAHSFTSLSIKETQQIQYLFFKASGPYEHTNLSNLYI
ncbi:hypothetical protein EV12_3011 [Prochlorococcus sp. MIT 0701]|nr:hypothetical protein EV12_3011 [Prochlorococcus sp. MIT 0701]